MVKIQHQEGGVEGRGGYLSLVSCLRNDSSPPIIVPIIILLLIAICFIIIITVINNRTIKDSGNILTYSILLLAIAPSTPCRPSPRYKTSVTLDHNTIHPPRPILSSLYYLGGCRLFQVVEWAMGYIEPKNFF